MPAAVCPCFHCRPSTTSRLLLASLSIRQPPTTLTNHFGSAPTVSSEKSTFRDCAAPAYVSSPARPTQAAAIVVVRLLVIMIDLLVLGWRFAAGGGLTTLGVTAARGDPPGHRPGGGSGGGS